MSAKSVPRTERKQTTEKHDWDANRCLKFTKEFYRSLVDDLKTAEVYHEQSEMICFA